MKSGRAGWRSKSMISRPKALILTLMKDAWTMLHMLMYCGESYKTLVSFTLTTCYKTVNYHICHYCFFIVWLSSLYTIGTLAEIKLNSLWPMLNMWEEVVQPFVPPWQQIAISAAKCALETPWLPKICLIQGPPGTGKTTTIIDIITRIMCPTSGNKVKQISLTLSHRSCVLHLVTR